MLGKRSGLKKISSIMAHDVYKNDRQKKIWNYTYEPSFSDENTAVYINNYNKSIIISSRGTADIDDVITDISILKNDLKNTERFKKLEGLINHLKSIYKGYHISTTGHSLGASLSTKTDVLSHTFNEGPDFDEKKKQNIKHRIEGDIISILNKDKSETEKKDERYSSHTIKQFADLQQQ